MKVLMYSNPIFFKSERLFYDDKRVTKTKNELRLLLRYYALRKIHFPNKPSKIVDEINKIDLKVLGLDKFSTKCKIPTQRILPFSHVSKAHRVRTQVIKVSPPLYLVSNEIMGIDRKIVLKKELSSKTNIECITSPLTKIFAVNDVLEDEYTELLRYLENGST